MAHKLTPEQQRLIGIFRSTLSGLHDRIGDAIDLLETSQDPETISQELDAVIDEIAFNKEFLQETNHKI